MGPLSGLSVVAHYVSPPYRTDRHKCWVAVASAGLYADHLHLAPDRWPCQHLITQFFTGWMLFLLPNQQRQSTEGTFCFFGCTQNTCSI